MKEDEKAEKTLGQACYEAWGEQIPWEMLSLGRQRIWELRAEAVLAQFIKLENKKQLGVK